MLGFGIGFELPMVMAFLARIDVINADGFREKRKYAVVLIFVASAILTPADALSMILMAVPLLCLYQLGIWFASLVEKRESEDYA
jgi:sec-independent protein translocase protein TatC